MSSYFKKLTIQRHPRLAQRETSEDRYWKKFQYPVVVKEYSAISSINFCPVAPFDFAVCSSTRVQLYSTKTNALKRSVSRFKDVVSCAEYRKDGKLLVAGCKDSTIQVFDTNSRAVLRTFEGHTRGVNVTMFSNDQKSVFSASDDSTVRVWDVAANEEALVLTGHTDYVRTGAMDPHNSHTFITGSYDHTVKLWDVRTKEAVMSFGQHNPVESVQVLPSGSVFVAAGGNEIQVWDLLAGRLLHTFSNHQKTITTLCVDGERKRLLSGSIDRQVKVYSLENYNVVHSMKYSSPVLSVAVSPSNSHLVVGMTNGLLSIRRRPEAHTHHAAPRKSARPRAGTYRFFMRGLSHKPSETDYKVHVNRKPHLKPYEKLLKEFKYSEALNAVMKSYRPIVIVSFLHELGQRSGLVNALRGRTDHALQPILSFVVKHITNPRYSPLLISVAEVILDTYAPNLGQSVMIDELFFRLHRKLKDELQFQQQLTEMAGMLDILMAGNTE
eukprot:m.183248 g.183248  ORF g.183248 m.183248 type:complete len:497 (+) comp21517_c1_seq2:131-1621(+)